MKRNYQIDRCHKAHAQMDEDKVYNLHTPLQWLQFGLPGTHTW